MEKINLGNVSQVLSEKELKNVLGGTNGCASPTGQTCPTNACVTDILTNGMCGWYKIGNAVYCTCIETGKKKGTPTTPNDSVPKPVPDIFYKEDAFSDAFSDVKFFPVS